MQWPCCVSPVAAGVSDGCACSELLGCLGDGPCAWVLTECDCGASSALPSCPWVVWFLSSRAGRGRRQLVRWRVQNVTGHLSANLWLSWPTDPTAWTAVSTWVSLLLEQLTQWGSPSASMAPFKSRCYGSAMQTQSLLKRLFASSSPLMLKELW